MKFPGRKPIGAGCPGVSHITFSACRQTSTGLPLGTDSDPEPDRHGDVTAKAPEGRYGAPLTPSRLPCRIASILRSAIAVMVMNGLQSTQPGIRDASFTQIVVAVDTPEAVRSLNSHTSAERVHGVEGEDLAVEGDVGAVVGHDHDVGTPALR